MNIKKDKSNKACTDFGFNFKDFQGMFERMRKCCPDLGTSVDCSTMMKQMMEACCGTKENKPEKDKGKE